MGREGARRDCDDIPGPDKPSGDYNGRASCRDRLEPRGWRLESGDWERGRVTRPGKDPGDGAGALAPRYAHPAPVDIAAGEHDRDTGVAHDAAGVLPRLSEQDGETTR